MECVTFPPGSNLGDDDRHSGGDGGEANGGGGLKPNAVPFTPSFIHSAPENRLKSHLPVPPNPLRSHLAFQSLPITVPSPENERTLAETSALHNLKPSTVSQKRPALIMKNLSTSSSTPCQTPNTDIESLNPSEELFLEEQIFDMKTTWPDGGATHSSTSELLQNILKAHCSRKATIFQFEVNINLDKLPKDTKLRRSIFQWVVEDVGDKVALAYLGGKIAPSFIHSAPGNILILHPPVPPNPLQSYLAFQSLQLSTPSETPNPDSELLANILMAQCSPGATILESEIYIDPDKVPKDRELRRSLFQWVVKEVGDMIALAYRDRANMKSGVFRKLTLDGKINQVVPDVAPGIKEESYEFHENSKTELLDNPQNVLGNALTFKINQRNARITAGSTFGYNVLLGQIVARLPLKQAFRLRGGDFIKEQVNAASENPTFCTVLHFELRDTLEVYSHLPSQFPLDAGRISTGIGVYVIGSCDGIVATMFRLLGQDCALDNQYSIGFGKQGDVFYFVKVALRLNLPHVLDVYSSNNNLWAHQNVDMEFDFIESCCDVVVNRKPYWRAHSGDNHFILRFDREVNRFTRIDYPHVEDQLGNFVNNKLIQHGQRIAFIDFTHSEPNLFVNIWEHTGQEWVSLLVLFNLQNVPFWLTPQRELLYKRNDGILVHERNNHEIRIGRSTPVVLNHWSTLTSF